MDLSKEIWHIELYKLQQQAPNPIVVVCQRKLESRPPQFGDEYHGNIDRKEVDRILLNYGTGAFLIRDSLRTKGTYTLVIRFEDDNKNYVLFYNAESGQHYVGYKYYDNVIDMVKDGLIHLYIESRGADVLCTIAEPKVYETTPFYRSRLYAIQNENFRKMNVKKQQSIDSGVKFEERDVKKTLERIENDNDSCDSGIFNSLRSDGSSLKKVDSSYDSIKTRRDSPEDPPAAPPRQKSLYHSLCNKNLQRPSDSQHSINNHYEPIYNCGKASIDDNISDAQEADSKINLERSLSSNQKPINRLGISKRLSNRITLIESQSNIFSQLEKNHNFKQHTFVGPQWCDFCVHFMWGLVAQGVQCFDCGFQAHKKCSDKVPADCFPVMKRLKRVFGIELTSLAKMENRAIPIIFEKLIKALEERDLTFQGLYRISGNLDIIEEVKADLDKDVESVDLKTDSRLTEVETLTGLIKLFLRQLPIPLITSELYTKLITILKTESDVILRQTQFKDSMSILNSAHYSTLEFFIRHLNTVSKYHRENFMTSSNLAIVFSPTLISKQNSQDADMSPEMLISRVQSDFKWDCTIIQELIDGCDSIFSKLGHHES